MALAHHFDGFLIDLDGVVYLGKDPVPGSVEALASLRAIGKRVVFLTNDPRSSRAEYATRLQEMGIEVDPEMILTAGFATASFIAGQRSSTFTRVFVVGSLALRNEMINAGLSVVDDDPAGCDVVVVGGHSDFNYSELRVASRLVRAGAAFFATGRDATFPMPDGPWPGTGAILAAVETASGSVAQVIGKPEPHMFAAARSMVPECERLVVVGDTLGSDIAGGQRAGLATVLVAPDGRDRDAAIAPDVAITRLSDLIT